VVGRLGGDEFAVLLHRCRIDDAETVGNKIITAIKALRFGWGGKVYAVGASIGLTAITDQSVSFADILAQADVACYAAKSSGRDRVSVYRPEKSEAHRHLADLRIAAGIREGIEQDRFRLYAQEIRSLASPLQRGRKLEVLTRMVTPDGQVVPPGAFIPAAERFDLMASLDRWVLKQVIRGEGARIASVPDLTVAVNLSANSLDDAALWDFLAGEMAGAGFDPSRLVLEITETAVINNFGAAERFVESARHAGCKVSLDDFGSGVSSFSYLKRFEVDSIKIDGAFVRNMVTSRYDRTIVRLIHEVGTELGIDTVAEFIEDTETVELLREIGVPYGQGYLFHRPRPLDEVLDEYGAARPGAAAGRLIA
jgi:EAL domain-containing protein (putative c-di-GMP-specific phosphodiesterase class I)